MSSNEAGTGKPQVVFVYYTYTQQSACVVETMADVPRERGCDVRQAQIDTDKRWAEQFSRLPFGKGENRERYLGIKIRPSSSSRTTRSRRAPSRATWPTASSTHSQT
jgi:hypothetical protein